MKFKKKGKKPKDTNKLLTKLAIYTTIVLTVVVSFFMISDYVKGLENEYTQTVETLNKLNDEFDTSSIITNAFSSTDFENMRSKCEEAGWDLFLNGGINTTKYNQLSQVNSSLNLTDKEYGTLLNGVLNITGNPNNVNFYEVTINKTENSSRVHFKTVYTFSIKNVLSIDDELNEALKELNVNLPNTVYAVSEATYDILTEKIITTNITYNNLSLKDSETITNLLNAGKETEENNIEYFSVRLILAMNEEFNTKTSTTTQFVNSGVNYVK